MKHLLLLIAALFCIQLGVNAQNNNAGAETKYNAEGNEIGYIVQAVKSKAPIAQEQKSEEQIVTQLIKDDLQNRTDILLNSKELNAALTERFGDEMSITSEEVVTQILEISNDENQTLLIRREALKVMNGTIPAGHILENQNTK